MMFDGFTAQDFEAYLPEKWGSNMFTLPRRRVKDQLDQLGNRLAGEFEAAGLTLVKHLSDDHPSLWNNKKVDTQWLFFSRDVAAQKELSSIIDTDKTLAATLVDPTPMYRHIFMGVSVDEHGLEVGLKLHNQAWVDRKNLIALLENDDSLEEFMELCRSLPAEHCVGSVGGEMTAPADVDRESLVRVVGESEKSDGWIFVGLKMGKDAAVELGKDAEGTVLEAVRILLPVYKFIAWSASNDAISIDNLVERRQQERRKSQDELRGEREQREARRALEEVERQRLRKEKEDQVRQDQEWRRREREVRRAAASMRARKDEEAAAQAALDARKNAEAAAAGAKTDADTKAEPLAEKSADKPVEVKEKTAPAEPNGNVRPPSAAPAQVAQPRFDNRRPQRSGAGRPRDQVQSRNTRDSRPPKTAPVESRPVQAEKTESARPVREVSQERKDDVQHGDGVIVSKGFLKGRFGIVQGVDEKGDLMVAFGSLNSRVPRGDVEGRGPAPGDSTQRKPKRR